VREIGQNADNFMVVHDQEKLGMTIRPIWLLAVGLLASTHRTLASPDDPDAVETKRITVAAGTAMINSHAHGFLSDLSDRIGARMTGTPQGERAIECRLLSFGGCIAMRWRRQERYWDDS
jgi:hypothetical protein